MVRRAFKIPLPALFLTVACLFMGELACGTDLYFAAMMAVTVCAAGITYNILGGLSTFSGMLYAMIAAGTVVISQFVKILLRQPADSHLADPALTATVYAIFFVATLFGSFTFRQIRLPLPHPAEPETELQTSSLYMLALVLGIAGDVLFNLTTVAYGNSEAHSQFNAVHSVGVALLALLPFAEIVAIDLRIRKSAGRHSLGIAAFVPLIVLVLTGLINTQRQWIFIAGLVYFLTCYFRGYRFRFRHYACAVSGALLFYFVLSPLELYTRSMVANQDFESRISASSAALAHADLRQVTSAESAVSLENEWEDYYWVSGSYLLSRVSLIRLDSNLIAACSNYHYGFNSIRQDLLQQLPHFVYPDKPEYASYDYLGRVSGVSAGDPWNTEPTFTLIADSFGSFGMLGVAITGLLLLPLALRVLEGIFDVSRPWGTAAFILFMQSLALASTVGILIGGTIRASIYLLALSYLCAMIAVFGATIVRFFFGSQRKRTILPAAGQTVES